MKNKIFKFVVLLLILFSFDSVYATSGALKKKSIKKCPNGVTYGYHGSGSKKHWHIAEKAPKSSSGWIASGSEISSDPCPKTTKTTATVKKSDNNKIESVTINGDIVPISKNMEYESKKNGLDIKVSLEDSKAKYNIIGDTDDLSLTEKREIKINVVSESGKTDSYLIQVSRVKIESEVRLKGLRVNDVEVEINNDMTASVFNGEDKLKVEYKLTDDNAKLIILKNGQEIEDNNNLTEGKNDYILKIVDKDENEYSYTLSVTRMTESESILRGLFSAAALGGIGYTTYYFVKKKKKA